MSKESKHAGSSEAIAEESIRLSVAHVTKRFSAVTALDDVSFAVRRGEVHALLGENGAGKSTLLNILSAVFSADGGRIEIDGRPVTLKTPTDAREAGIAMIHQELQLIPELTVAQNLFLGTPLRRWGGLLVDSTRQEKKAAALLQDLDPGIDPRCPIRNLKVAQQQIIEIARALLADAKIIAMDEPTSSLTPAEFERLARLIEKLKARGVSVIYVSHKLDEVFRVCDRATVLRDGQFVKTVDLAAVTESKVVSLMVGRDVAHDTHTSHASQTIRLRATDLSDGHTVHRASFVLHRGEVLGVAGLVGSGRTELLRLVSGVERIRAGKLEIDGQGAIFRSPRQAITRGIGLVPEERKAEGIVRARSVAKNIALPCMYQFSMYGCLRETKLKRESNALMSRMNLRPLDVLRPIGAFSGGNQQKAIIGRWVQSNVDVLLFDEPTRGIDIGAKAEIYELIEALAAEGKAIVVVSSEIQEILRVSDRVLVMREGEVAATLSGEQISEAQIAYHAIPQSQSSARPTSN